MSILPHGGGGVGLAEFQGGWVSPGGGGGICRSVGMPKFWVGGSLN